MSPFVVYGPRALSTASRPLSVGLRYGQEFARVVGTLRVTALVVNVYTSEGHPPLLFTDVETGLFVRRGLPIPLGISKVRLENHPAR